MKKIVQISSDNNTIALEQKEGEQFTFVKVYDSQRRLVRHSRTSGKRFILTAPPGKYILESDSDLKSVEESNIDQAQSFKQIYKHLELDLPNNMLTLKGIPFYQTDDIGTFINRMVKDKKELKGYAEAYYEKIAQKEHSKMLSDDKVLEVLMGGGTPTEKAKIRKDLQDFSKEKKRISVAIQKAKNAGEILKIVPKFSKSISTDINDS